MERQLVVIGGTAAGLSAASKAKRSNPELGVTVFEKSGYVSYGACGLPYYIGNEIQDEMELISLTVAQLKEKRKIDTYIHHEVIEINRADKYVVAKNLANGEIMNCRYDDLVIATGAVPVVPTIEGVNYKNVHVLRNIEDGISIKSSLSGSIKKVSIIGGGFIGLEVTEQLTNCGIQVSLFESMPRLLPFLDEGYSEIVKQTLEQHFVQLYLNSTVVEVIGDGSKATHIRCSDGTIVESDMIIISIGVKPNSALAINCGLETGYKGGIAVDKYMRTSDASIWACGDCVQMYNLITGEPTYIPLGTTANKQGRIAGSNLIGEQVAFNGVLASQVTKIFDLYIASTGLTLSQAGAAGFDARSSKIVKGDKASYYPGGKDNHICLIFDRGGRLLGAQAIGSESIAGRMNVFVTAITAQMTIGQLNELDLVYSPSVAPVYDPILIAANTALKQVVN